MLIHPPSTPISQYVPQLSPRLSAPTQFGEALALLDNLDEKPQRLIIRAPPRWGSTNLALHLLVRFLTAKPSRSSLYATYDISPLERDKRRQVAQRILGDVAHQPEAESVEQVGLPRARAKQVRDLCRDAGQRLQAESNKAVVRTALGSDALFCGVGSTVTGTSCNLIILDSPLKNREEAGDAARQERLNTWIQSMLLTRLLPGGSVIIFESWRFEGDYVEKLVAEGFRLLNLPAAAEPFNSNWAGPGGRSTADLLQVRASVGEKDWASLYLGVPVPMDAPTSTTATAEQADILERVEVLELIRAALAELPLKLGDKTFIRVGDSINDALHEARRKLPPAGSTLPRKVDGRGLLLERIAAAPSQKATTNPG